MIVASEKLEMQVESKLCEFRKWDICILNSAVRHMEHFKPDTKIYYLAFSPEYLLSWPDEEGMNIRNSLVFSEFIHKGLLDTLHQNKDYITFRFVDSVALSSLLGLVTDIRKEFEQKKPGYQLFIRGLVYRLFCVLSDPECYEAEYTDLGFDGGFSLALSAKKILDRTKEKITKHDLAERLNYNYEHISRVFVKHYKLTIPAYNKKICMREAASLLSKTTLSISIICKSLGYVNRTNFYNVFRKEYGCSPMEYRDKSIKN
jgi:AraC-like DNA-binding protein